MSILEKSRSSELSRRTQPFYAKKQNYRLGEQVQIEIDVQREFLDMESLRIQFKLQATSPNGGGDTESCEYLAASCIRNLRVKTLSGQMIGHEMRDYRSFAKWKLKQLQDHDVPSGVDATNNATWYGDMEAANGLTYTDNATSEFQISHKPMAHIFGIKDYYPAHFHQGIMIEFDLVSASQEIFNELAANLPVAGSVSFNDVRVMVDLVELKGELETEMVRLMEEQKLFVDYIEWLNQENTMEGSAPAFDVVGIDGRVKSAFTFFNQVKGTGAGTDTDYVGFGNDKYNLASYRYRLGSRYLNYAPIDTSGLVDAERELEMTKALDIHQLLEDGRRWGSQTQKGLADVDYTVAAARNDSWYGVGVKVDKAMKDVDEVISSQVDKDRNNLRVEFTGFEKPAADSVKANTFIILDKRLQLLPGSVIRNVRA